jgi:hypothetical protein
LQVHELAVSLQSEIFFGCFLRAAGFEIYLWEFGKTECQKGYSRLSLLPNDFNKKLPDNFILSVALKYKRKK